MVGGVRGADIDPCVASWPELVRNSTHLGLRFMSMRNLMRPNGISISSTRQAA